jgi:hypothetical protein
MRIVGLGYKARSGKDTIAKYLTSQPNWYNMSFAARLKYGCQQIFGFTPEQLFGDDKEKLDSFWGLSPRAVLQLVGTECMRNTFGEDVWIKALQRSLFALPLSANVVITDVRFHNEAEAIKRWGGQLIRVDRPGFSASNGIDGHSSESELDGYVDWDAVITNDGTLDELYARVRRDILGIL